MKKVFWFNILFGCFVFCSFQSYSLQHNKDDSYIWKVGIAKEDITPQKLIWMAGYALRNHIAEGVLNRVYTKALVVEDVRGNRAVFISLDLAAIDKVMSDTLKARIGRKYGFSRGQIIINVSHSHSAPSTFASKYGLSSDEKSGPNDQEITDVNEYGKTVYEKIVKVVGEALKAQRPARLYTGNGISRFAVNRNTNDESYLSPILNLNGPNDYSVPVIKAMDDNGKIFGILFGYSCHPSSLRSNSYLISGDYASFAQENLEKEYPGSVAMFFQATGGDQGALPRGGPAKAKKYGGELAVAARSVIEEEMTPLASDLKVAYKEIDLPYSYPVPTREEFVAIMNDSLETLGYPFYLRRVAREYIHKLDLGETIDSMTYDYPMAVWKLGSQAIFALGGEVTSGYSLNLKRIYGFESFVFGYSNYLYPSYIPTAELMRERGQYEGNYTPLFTTPYRADIELLIVGNVSALAKTIGVVPKPIVPLRGFDNDWGPQKKF